MFHFHILAGAQLGGATPTQARAGTSHGEEAWSHVLLSHPRAGAASPPGMPDLWGQEALLQSQPFSHLCGVAVLAQWWCSAPHKASVPSVAVGYLHCCPHCWVGVCDAGLSGWECCWHQLVASLELPVPSHPQCIQRVSPSGGPPSTEPWLLRGPAGA